MAVVMSACGVLCSECAAYRGRERGLDHQRRAAAKGTALACSAVYDDTPSS